MLENYLSPQELACLRAEQISKVGNSIKYKDILTNWQERLPQIYPHYFSKPFASYHHEMWQWVEDMPETSPPAFIAIWPRGGGKSTGAEVAAVELGASGKRLYCWYVRSTQDLADKSVENIAAILGGDRIEEYYPAMSQPKMGKHGKPKAWRRNRLVTSNNFTIDALGLDTAARGTKDEERRPDLIILDDIDGRHDGIAKTTKKMEIIKESILPAGALGTVAVLAIQNAIIPDGIFSQLADGRADFLLDRIVSGPHPAAHNLTYKQIEDGTFKIISADPTWPEGQGIKIMQSQINLWGLTAFNREAQHDVDKSGGVYDHIEFRHCTWDELPDMERKAVWVDPAVTSTDKSDSMGIQAGGVADGTLYMLYSKEFITSPEDAICTAIRKAIEIGAGKVGIETDQGGDTWRSVYRLSMDKVKKEKENEYRDAYGDDWESEFKDILWPTFGYAKAGAGHGGKTERGMRMLTSYDQGKVVHVIGTHTTLEKALYRFPNKPLDLADAAYWVWADLMNKLSPRKMIDSV